MGVFALLLVTLLITLGLGGPEWLLRAEAAGAGVVLALYLGACVVNILRQEPSE